MSQTIAKKNPSDRTAEKQRLGLSERLALIGLIDEGMLKGSSDSPIVADLFNDLWHLVERTVSGAKIDHLKPYESRHGFRLFEIKADTGEKLGRLNMLYLKKPVPCYYLVYVEVAPPFRKKGLGYRILAYFRDFLDQKSAVGILDNIIPENDPTYDIYFRQAWESIAEITGEDISDKPGNYMIYIPPRLKGKNLRQPVVRLVHHLRRKRAAIDMRDNESIVRTTISEFKDLYAALHIYFDEEIRKGGSSLLMRFMFTRFVTKLIAFRRRISNLLGYTGGESMEQLVLSPQIAELPVQSYTPLDTEGASSLVTGDKKMWLSLPDVLRRHPAHVIESLPNYARPSLISWMKERGKTTSTALRLGDLMDLGFDPTRLKEITINDDKFIFERIQARQLREYEGKKSLLDRIASKKTPGLRAGGSILKVNPPLLILRDRGNGYILRRKINGIHWEEAVEQLKTIPVLKKVNELTKCESLIFAAIKTANKIISEQLEIKEKDIYSMFTYFVSWDLKCNQPKFTVEFAGTFLDSVWIA